MDNAKLKNIIILLLLALNIALLGIVLAERCSSRETALELRRNAENALRSNGLELASDVDLSAFKPEIYTLSRRQDQERKYVGRILGTPLSAEDVGGGIVYYEGADGMARFHGTGEFEAYLSAGIFTANSDFEKTAYAFLKKLGISIYEPLTATEDRDSGRTVSVICAVDGAPIYNCGISLDFIDGSLMAVSGCRPLYNVKSAGSEVEPLDIYTVILRFLALWRSEGTVGSEVRSIVLGYKLTSSLSGESTLTPLWHLMTDTGEYYIDGLTGEPVQAF